MMQLQIPDYRIIRELGSGAMGTVYEAVHTRLGRSAAIKVVRPEHARDPELESRFINEARALARVRHPSIVLVFEFGVLPNGTAYLAMEFLRGESLGDRWRKRRRDADITPELRLLQQIAHALALLHRHGVVHRDLKPENVMVTPEVGRAAQHRAKLVDFGLAKLIRLSGSKTASSLIMGTPAYMSPEQCRGAGQVGAKTDCYALGVMLYELIADRLPFDAAWPGDLIAMHLQVEPTPLSMLVPSADPRLAVLVGALLRKDAAHRPAMSDVAAYLLALADPSSYGANRLLPSLEPQVDAFEDTRLPVPVAISDLPPAAAGQEPPITDEQPEDRPPSPLAPGAAQQSPRAQRVNEAVPKSRDHKRVPRWASFVGAVGILILPLLYFSINRHTPETNTLDLEHQMLYEYLNQQASLSQQLGPITRLPSEDSRKPDLPSQEAEHYGREEPTNQVPALKAQPLPERHAAEGVQNEDVPKTPIQGAFPVLPPEVVHLVPCHIIKGNYQVCIQPDGSILSAKPLVSIAGADGVIIKALRGWQYAPHRGPQCIEVPISFRVDSQLGTCIGYPEEVSSYIRVDSSWLEENIRGGPLPQPAWPKDLPALPRCQTKKATYEIYVNKQGTVDKVVPVSKLFKTGSPGEQDIVAALSGLNYGALAFPVCVTHTLTFTGLGEPQSCKASRH